MDSSSSSSPASSALPPSEAKHEAKMEGQEKGMVHRTKVIHFLGRTTPIILQNDNGPCPLLAICNVLSLKNSLNSSPDVPEISQENLLSFVAERLIDSNSNSGDKDAGFVENQQQNIADAIDLLPRLTTGIDVNIKFRRIDDFEFTRECAIFDLLDIPLYHGWIVDPQDSETADAIGSKSYNTVMEELVSLETQAMDNEKKNDLDDDVDFAAATTAALGVPTPCLSRGQSFDESPQNPRKGDIEEETEFSRVLKLSGAEKSNSFAAVNIVENPSMDKFESVVHLETVEKNVTDEIEKNGTSNSDDSNALSSKTVQENNFVKCTSNESTESHEIAVDNISCGIQIENQNSRPSSLGEDSQSSSNAFLDKPRSVEHVKNEFTSSSVIVEPKKNPSDCEAANLDSKNGQVRNIDNPDAFTSSGDGGEPMYEGEERILGNVHYEDQEPIYEGEVVLGKQVDDELKGRISVKQGELIRNFMKNSASQLTIYGLFCLQDKVKERELCVFFRNNHFNTMFKVIEGNDPPYLCVKKYEGELYILATDQGYINQPDLVWEKLNEVNGDTLFMTGNFKEFKMDDQSNTTWDEQNAITSTADYLACVDGVAPADSSFNSDMQLAIALQQQEFEQQQQQQPQRSSQQPSAIGGSGSRLVTGPQVSQYVPPPKQQPKSKDKCIVM